MDKKNKRTFIFITVILAIVLLEVGLQVINGFTYLFKDKPMENLLLSHYPDKNLAETLWAETLAPRKDPQYVQFLGWANKPYQGKYVNVDAQRGRKTWNPEASPGQTPEVVYLFGGSAAWGFGVRDDYTIPSYFSRFLHEHGNRFVVSNYGEPGYTFTQSIVHLILKLREGKRPHYVIFYDGFNDLYAAHQHGVAGTIHNIGMINEKLQMRYRDIIWRGIVEAFRKYCMIYQAINGVYIHYHPTAKYQEVAVNYSDIDLQSLAKSVVDDFKNSMNLLDHLSQVYNFHYIVFWQPSIYTERKAIGENIKEDPRLEDVSLGKICRYANEFLQKESIPHFYNFTDALRDRTGPVYIDVAHISEPGNELIAKEMYQVFKEEFLSKGQMEKGKRHQPLKQRSMVARDNILLPRHPDRLFPPSQGIWWVSSQPGGRNRLEPSVAGDEALSPILVVIRELATPQIRPLIKET